MRVLFTVSSWAGHYRSMVPLGWALQAAGHEVRVACARSEVATIAGAGLTPVPLIDGWPMQLQGRLQNYLNAQAGLWSFPDLPPHPLTGETMADLDEFDLAAFLDREWPDVLDAARRSTDGVVAYACNYRPDLVLHDLVSIEGALAGRVLGVPVAVHPWGPLGTAERDAGVNLEATDFSGAFDRYGVGPRGADYFLDPAPAAMAPPTEAHRLPVRYVPYNGPGSAPDWAPPPPGRRRVCLVWGHSTTRILGPASWVVPAVIEALADMDLELVVTLNEADFASLGPVGPHVRALCNVPLHLFLPSCAAVIHHGGGNSVLNGAIAGVPQLALSQGLDQPLMADRLAATGAGLHVPGSLATADTIRDAVTDLLDDLRHRAAAGVLRRQMLDAPSPARVATTLAGLAARGPSLDPVSTGSGTASGSLCGD